MFVNCFGERCCTEVLCFFHTSWQTRVLLRISDKKCQITFHSQGKGTKKHKQKLNIEEFSEKNDIVSTYFCYTYYFIYLLLVIIALIFACCSLVLLTPCYRPISSKNKWSNGLIIPIISFPYFSFDYPEVILYI